MPSPRWNSSYSIITMGATACRSSRKVHPPQQRRHGTGYTQLDNADQSFDDRKNAQLFVPRRIHTPSATVSGLLNFWEWTRPFSSSSRQ